MSGNSSVTVRGAPPAVALAVAAGRLLIEPATVGGPTPGAGPDPALQLRTLADGASLGTITAHGHVRAIALGAAYAAVLADVGEHRQIERYAIPSDRVLGVSPVPPSTASHLTMSGRTVAYAAGRAIYALDLPSGTQTRVATAAATPIGLSLDGRRLAWGENILTIGKLTGRVRVLNR